jgi:hypothetical protein
VSAYIVSEPVILDTVDIFSQYWGMSVDLVRIGGARRVCKERSSAYSHLTS